MEIFKEILGHEIPKKIIIKRIEDKNSGHAFLFTGEEHLGKNKLANEFISIMNCETKNNCGKCKNCRQISRKSFPYFIEVTSKWSEIKKDTLSEKLNFLHLRAPDGIVKFLLIDDAANLNVSSSNMLLKTIEEPPKDTIVILITSRIDTILPTIKSRCQIISFKRVNSKIIKNELSNLDPKLTDDIINTTEGKPGILKLIMDNLENFQENLNDENDFISNVDFIYEDVNMDSIFEIGTSTIDYSKIDHIIFSRSLAKMKMIEKFVAIIENGTTWEALSSANYLKVKITNFFNDILDNLNHKIDEESQRFDKKIVELLKKEGKEKIKSFKEEEIHDIIHFLIKFIKNEYINGKSINTYVKWLKILSELKQIHLRYNVKSDTVIEHMVIELRRNRFDEA
jgi:DNA polymerase-3 subunit delta'